MTRKKYISMLNDITKESSYTDLVDAAKEVLQRLDLKKALDKSRFDWLKKHSKGRSKKLNNPWSGKNKTQRNRLAGAFSDFHSTNRARFNMGGYNL